MIVLIKRSNFCLKTLFFIFYISRVITTKSKNSWIFRDQFSSLGVNFGREKNCVVHTYLYILHMSPKLDNFLNFPIGDFPL